MISIIGAGPTGSYLAYLLAKSGKEVSVFEEHSEIGKPVHCTGLITSSIEKLIPLKKELILNTITKVKVFSPNNSYLELNILPNYIIDRAKFDRYIAKLALSAGAKYFFNHQFIDYKKPYIIFKNRKAVKTNIIVGADGPVSKVAKSSGLYKNRKFVVGLQVRAKFKTKKDTIEFYLAKNYFGWIVPESNTIAKIGIVTSINPNLTFKDFMKKKAPKAEIIEHQSRLIPVYDSKIQTHKDSVYLVGDAATMVKATTYGGIIQGMIASEALANSLLHNLDYERAWRKKLSKELYFHLIIRRTMDNFSEEDYNELLKLVQKKEIKKILQEHNRDDFSSFAFKLLIAEPKLLKFGFKIL